MEPKGHAAGVGMGDKAPAASTRPSKFQKIMKMAQRIGSNTGAIPAFDVPKKKGKKTNNLENQVQHQSSSARGSGTSSTTTHGLDTVSNSAITNGHEAAAADEGLSGAATMGHGTRDAGGNDGGNDSDPDAGSEGSSPSIRNFLMPCQIHVETQITTTIENDLEFKARWADTWSGALVVAEPDRLPTNTWLGFNFNADSD